MFKNIKNPNAKHYYMNIGRNIEDSSTLLVFSETNILSTQILVHNKQNTNIKISIQGDTHDIIEPKMKKCLTWIVHNEENKYIHIKTEESVQESVGKEFIFNNDETINKMKLPFEFELNKKLDIQFSISGFSLLIIIKESKRNDNSFMNPSLTNEIVLKCDLFLLTISIVSDNRHVNNIIDYSTQYKRRELCLFSLGDITFMYYNKLSGNNNYQEYEITFSTNFLKIDNMSGPFLFYPVIFKSIDDNENNDTNMQNVDIPFLNFIIECYKSNEDNILFIEQTTFTIQQLEIILDTDFCDLLYDLILNITMGTDTTMKTIHSYILNRNGISITT